MTAIFLGLAAILAAIWWVLATAPEVRPGRCHMGDIREGRTECGGPCRKGTPPCMEDS